MHLRATESLYAMVDKIGKLFQREASCEGEKASVIPLFGLLFHKMNECGADRIRMTDVSHQLMITKPAATQAVNRLVEKGLVERVYDENDRRVVYIRPTKRGHDIFCSELEKRQDFVDRAVKRMGEADANLLADLLDRFLTAVEEELEETT